MLKTIFNFAGRRATAVVCAVAGLCAAGQARAAGEAERLAALVSYVAADYPGAVKDGQVIAADEYAEQRTMLGEAAGLVRALAAPPGREAERAALAADLDALVKRVDARGSEAEIAGLARAVTRRLLDGFGLVLAPSAPPDLARAKALYAQSCAPCHGATGHAETEQAKLLKPAPVSFFDDERMARVSPTLAYHAITFGVTGTAMASFDTLPAQDRWSLAFYVLSLRHAGGALERGAAVARAGLPVTASPSRLAALSDQELDAALAGVVTSMEDRRAVVDHLRAQASFARAPGGAFAEARRLLDEVSQAAGDPARARSLAVAAYLDGVEPHEAALKARDRALADRIERAFLELRRAIDRGDPDAVRREVTRTAVILDGAEEHRGGSGVPFLAALAIALREGFELSLLIGALLAFVRRAGRPDQARFIHLGWAAAVPAGLITWFAVGAVLGGAQRELTEAVLTLLAAAMLLFVSHFVLGRLESRKWLKFLERKTTDAAKAAVPWPLVGTAFVAAFREAVEIVLFFRALVLDSPGGAAWVALGAAAGAGLLAVLVWGLDALGRRLSPRPVMLASSVLLTVLAVALVGQGIHALQTGDYLAARPLEGLPQVPVLGLFPTVETLAAQLVTLALVLVPVWLERRAARSAKASVAA